ncbi:MAG: LysM peptidoglycan-binding domain-containing protein [Planctomycetes bacterium]|nr:LysM peptidoglycan-binding domain-containing protein [Planctomycetota bacterium]
MATDLERYGVFALIFVVLLIVGISIWGPQREDEPLLAAAGVSAAKMQPIADGVEQVGEGRDSGLLADPRADYEMESLTAFYKVQACDNPTKIARKLWRNDLHIDALLAANPGVRPNALRANDLLRLPAVDEAPDARYVIPGHELAQLAVSSGSSAQPNTGAPEKKVSPERPSDDLAHLEIDKRGGGQPIESNGGAKKTPEVKDPKSPSAENAKTEPRTAERPSRYHVVRKGERLEKIAKRYYGSPTHVAKIQAANPALKNPDQIRAGMKLILP